MQSYKSLPHQIRRVFERRNAQKPELYGVRRFAKRNWNRRTQRYRHTLVRVWRMQRNCAVWQTLWLAVQKRNV